MSDKTNATFGLKVISVNGVFYDDRAEEIILPCEDGELAILAEHEEMILALSDGIIKIKKPGGEWLVGVVSLGSVQVANNRCIVLVNTVERPEDIDKRRAQEAYEFAMEHLAQKQSIKEFKKSQAGLARALSRLKAASKYTD
ncbi:F-type H+-transporting ATPase subunit epsilon [Butyrivibrio sp. INlla18]|uniref:ATP synthase F1 subunit epsilon n=1 Tax=Butyrivibrio sp. INlla18 TaxID=1520806 RepID=UPI00088F8AE5|nr:ATP synthase F1 subunit epsilon [Butyrivibrio sp. INlla18]SDA51210.1 F-type H+-transporting ATPase subunit epsilon [Butyrivibrio sp. INlla18]